MTEKYLQEKDFKMRECGGNNAVYEDFLYRVQFYVYEKLRAKGFIVNAGPQRFPRSDWSEKELAAAKDFLKEWGLDKVLREYDDPVLWATVILEHWECIDNPRVVGSRLEFEALNEENEKVKPGEALWTLDLTPPYERHPPYEILIIWGPRVGSNEATVQSEHRSIGGYSGLTTEWRKEGGRWFNTGKVLTSWEGFA